MNLNQSRAEWKIFVGAVMVYAAYMLREEVLLIFAAAMFAIILFPLVRWTQRLRIGKWSPGRGTAIVLLLAMVVLCATLFAVFALPKVANDLRAFASNAPTTVQNLQDRISRLPYGASVAQHLDNDTLQRAFATGARSAFVIFQGISKGVLAFVSLVVLTLYFILEAEQVIRWGISLFPLDQRPRLKATLDRASTRVQRWLSGQALLMFILGTSASITFGLLGIRYSLALGIFAGIANFVPILGPIATVILAGLVAVADSWTKLLGVLIFYAVYQQIENSLLTPRIMRFSVGLPATAVIIALMIGSTIAGVIGALLAVPTAALIATLIDEYVVHRAPASLEHIHEEEEAKALQP